MINLALLPKDAVPRFAPDLPPRVFVPLLARFVVRDGGDEELAEVTFERCDMTNRTGWLSIDIAPEYRRCSVRPWAGFGLALDWAFSVMGFRQLYAEALEHIAYDGFDSIVGPLTDEPIRLPRAQWHEGEYEDLLMYTIRADRWMLFRSQRWMRRLMRRADPSMVTLDVMEGSSV